MTSLSPALTDAVSSLEFSRDTPSLLLSSSWDNHLRVHALSPSYPVNGTQLVADFDTGCPLLDSCFSDSNHAFSAGLNGKVSCYDLVTGNYSSLGKHESAARCVKYSAETDLLVSGGWDKRIILWDSRQLGGSNSAMTELPEKVFSISTLGHKVVVAMANRLIFIYDLRNMSEPLQRRESSLKFMTRTVCCTPDNEGFVSTSIEGRVAVEFFDPSPESQARKYAFKCHRSNPSPISQESIVYPVNAITFHPRYGTFASAGGDGVVALWDYKAKKRLKAYQSYGKSISAIAFSWDSRFLAVGAGGSGNIEDLKGSENGSIWIRELGEGEGKGKGT